MIFDKEKNFFRFLCIGDIFGPRGVYAAISYLTSSTFSRASFDFIIANIENASPRCGLGPTVDAFNRLTSAGVSVFTGGNHSFDNKYAYSLYENKNVLRPCNFPSTAPGRGFYEFFLGSFKIVVINVQLRVFMRELLSCPFRSVESILKLYSTEKNCLFVVDLHGETTAEKLCFGAFFDGNVSAIYGTHTHVQTADARIMPKGTGYITDVGMVGAHHSSLGISFDKAIHRMINQTPIPFEVEEKGDFVFSAIDFSVCKETKKCIDFNRIYELISL
jgi:metallophosphoesterase (TIGR00282 family)